MKLPISGEFEEAALIVIGCIIGAALVVLVSFMRGWLS